MDALFLARFILTVLDVNAMAFLLWFFLRKRREVSCYFAAFLFGRTLDVVGQLLTMITYHPSLPTAIALRRLAEGGIKTALTITFACYIFGIIGKNKHVV